MDKPNNDKTHPSPAIERDLREGNKAEARRLGERDTYPKGSTGMAEYIAKWEMKWKKITEEQDKKGRAQAYRFHRFLQSLSTLVLSLADNHF